MNVEDVEDEPKVLKIEEPDGDDRAGGMQAEETIGKSKADEGTQSGTAADDGMPRSSPNKYILLKVIFNRYRIPSIHP